MKTYLFFGLFFILYLYEIGNLNGLRQGTEGFYLFITKEMFQTDYFLTPRFNGINHWSKPPLHFWLPFPFYSLFKNNYLLWARFSIFLLSISSLIFISKWYQKHFKTDWKENLIFFLCCFGVFKYSRIYMMEAPLSFISTLCLLFFYEAFFLKSRKYFFLSSLFLGLSILIKGPVSAVMIIGSSSIFLFISGYREKKWPFLKYFKWMGLGLSLGSLWFIWCYYTYGSEFIDYFFIRENLGKFQAKNYPVTAVIQGLLLYGLPYSFFLPLAIFHLKDKEIKHRDLFTLVSFSIFFFLWFLPKQKSHHYAISSLPFFLIILKANWFDLKSNWQDNFLFKCVRYFLGVIILLSIALSLFIIQFKELLNYSWADFFILLTILTISFILTFLKKHKLSFPLAFSLFTISIWSLLIPKLALPIIPEKALSQIGQESKVGAIFRKPFYITEALNREVTLLIETKSEISSFFKSQENIAIIPLKIFQREQLKGHFKILHRWPLWKRGINYKALKQALETKKFNHMQDQMVLIQALNSPLLK